jgi:NADH-quinone oxidoreductase subunit M
MPTLLLVLLFLPLAGAVAAALLGPGRAQAIRWTSLLCTVAALVIALAVAAEFVQHREQAPVPTPGPDEPLAFAPTMTLRWDLLPLWVTSSGPAAVIQFYLGIDGLNIWLVVLTALLMVPSVLVSWTAIEDRVPEYYAWLLALETAMLGVFLSFDVVLFYVFFELTLVPLFFLIGIWGGAQRQYAARKFFIYTLTGSLVTLLGIVGITLTLPREDVEKPLTFAIPELVRRVDENSRQLASRAQAQQKALQDAERDRAQKQRALEAAGGDNAREAARVQLNVAEEQVRSSRELLRERVNGLDYWRRVQFWAFVAMMCGFAIKVPLFPVHTWLPLAHTEAPTAGSVLLAGVLLKVGTYGFLRLCVPLAPDAALNFGAPFISVLAVIGIIYGAFCALAQDDIKKLVAYSSVSHLGTCMLGLFALNQVGLEGSVLQMVNHGLSTGALFLLVGMLYERYHTRKMADYGGMAAKLHLLAAAFVFITMSSVGLPGLNGFVSEVLTLMGMYDFRGGQVDGRLLAALACSGVVLGAWYMLTLVRGVFFGPVREPAHEAHGHGPRGDLNGREVAALAPIAVACVLIGVYPKLFLDTMRPDLGVVARIADRARSRPPAPPLPPAPDRTEIADAPTGALGE